MSSFSLDNDDFKAFLSSCMTSFKCSAHDIQHCYRVANIALKIVNADFPDCRRDIVWISALSHDILDSKFISDGNEIEATLYSYLKKVFNDNDSSIVMGIVKDIGYKNLLKTNWNIQEKSIEYRCVQDADLLDAIGSIGISRCYAYGGSKNRDLFGLSDVLPVESHEDYMKQRNDINLSNLQHFFDKLLRIKSLLTTGEGIRMAIKKHDAMVRFLESLAEELTDAGSDDGPTLKMLLCRLDPCNT